MICMCAFCVLYRWGSLYIYSFRVCRPVIFRIRSTWCFFFLGRSHNQLCGWILHDHDGALSNIRFQEHLAQTTNIACSTTVQWLGWCVTWETDDTIWIRLIFFNYIHNHSYICVHFQHGPLKTLTNFPSQISGEVQWPLILTGSDVCSWKGQKAS